METTEKPFEIRFYKEALFDEEQLFMEVSAGCMGDEVSCHVTLDNYPAEQIDRTSGTPSLSWDIPIGSSFYEVMKEALTGSPGEEQEYLKFHLTIQFRTADTPKRMLEEKHTIRIKNPLSGVKREAWPEWNEPQFDLPEMLDKAPQQDDFVISVSPQYTGGDSWDFLDGTGHFVIMILTGIALKKCDVTAQLMQEWQKEKLTVAVNPMDKAHEITVNLSANLLDQVKDLGTFSHGENEKFDYFFELEITDAADKKHRRKVSVQLPNPYYEGIQSEKQIAREALAEVFQRKYGEDIAELKIEGQSGWWAWRKDDARFQYGWKDEVIVLYRYFGAVDYDADEDKVWEAMCELTEFADGAGDFVYVDNYFVLKYEFSPEWMDADDLEKKFDEFEEFAGSEELTKFLAAYAE